MRKSRFTESQIVQILAEYNAGASMEELARRNGVHANTIRLWRTKYAGMSSSDLSRLKELEAENAQMQRIIARQTVKIDAIEQLMRKTPGAFPANRSREGLARVRFESTRGVQMRSCASSIVAREAHDKSAARRDRGDAIDPSRASACRARLPAAIRRLRT